MELNFDPQNHQYTVDGKAVPSVTQLVAPLGADYDEPDDFTEFAIDNAADRGIAMHAYLAHRLAGGAEDEFELPAEYEGYIDAVEAFLSEHEITPYYTETPMCAVWRGVTYAGTPDLIGEVDGVLTIVDYKFVSQVAKSKVGAQLHGYRVLCEENGIYPSSLIAVQFLKDGDYRVYRVGDESAESFEICVKLQEKKTMKHPRGAIA